MSLFTEPGAEYRDADAQPKIEQVNIARCADRMSYGSTPMIVRQTDDAYNIKSRFASGDNSANSAHVIKHILIIICIILFVLIACKYLIPDDFKEKLRGYFKQA